MQNPNQLPAGIPQLVRVLRIILVSLILGALVFLIVLVNQGNVGNPEGNRAQNPPGSMTFMAVMMTAVCLPLAFIVPKLMVRNRILFLRRRQPADLDLTGRQLLGLYQSGVIIGASLAEGPAFLSIFAYKMEGSVVGLVLAFVCLASIAIRFPRQTQVVTWLEASLRQIYAADDHQNPSE